MRGTEQLINHLLTNGINAIAAIQLMERPEKKGYERVSKP